MFFSIGSEAVATHLHKCENKFSTLKHLIFKKATCVSTARDRSANLPELKCKVYFAVVMKCCFTSLGIGSIIT